MPGERQIILVVDERVHAYLSKLADAAGRAPTRYAQELFEAAYAVRCGVVKGDLALEAAVAAIAATPTPAVPNNDAAMSELRDQRDVARAEVKGLNQRIERLQADVRRWIDDAGAADERAEAAVAELEAARAEFPVLSTQFPSWERVEVARDLSAELAAIFPTFPAFERVDVEEEPRLVPYVEVTPPAPAEDDSAPGLRGILARIADLEAENDRILQSLADTKALWDRAWRMRHGRMSHLWRGR